MAEYQDQYKPQEGDGFDIKKILHLILIRWYWFVLSVITAYTVSWLINRYTAPSYSVTSTLLLNEEKKSTAELLVSVLDRYSPRKNIENEMAILKSYSMAAKTLKQLGFDISYHAVGRVRESLLYPKAPFVVIPDSAVFYGTRVDVVFLPDKQCRITMGDEINEVVNLGEKFSRPGFSFTVALSENTKYEEVVDKKYFFVINGFNSLVNSYKNQVSVVPNEKRGTVLTLSLSGESPQKAADYLNALMDVYIQNGLDEKNQTSINTIQFIDEQFGYVTDSLKRTEDALQEFRLNNKSFNFSQEGNTVLNKLSELQSEKWRIKTQVNYYEYLQKYIDGEQDLNRIVVPSIVDVSDPVLNSLVGDLIQLNADKALMSMDSDPQKNPLFRSLNVRLNSILSALRENIKQLIASATVSLNNIEESISSVEQELLKLPVTERRLLTIQREYTLNSETYNFLLKKRADAAISKASNVADNKVLDYAMAQNAVKIAPKTVKNNLIAIALGLLIPLAIIFITDFFNQTITDLKEIKNSTTIPIIGMIGHNNKDSDIPVAENPASPLSESFRALRTNLHYILRDKESKIINITSTVSGEGKTFIAANLATMIAHSGKKVLLMGLDLRKSRVSRIFNINSHEGISTYLIGDTGYEDLIRPTNINNLYVAPSGPVPPNPAELIETPEMRQLLEMCCADFDFVVIDTPPIAVVVDSMLLARFADVNLFIVRQNTSSKDSILLANDLKQHTEIKGLGIVVNDVSHSSAYGFGKYRYSYNYGYGYNYSSYGNYYSSYSGGVKSQNLWNRIFSKKKS